MVENVEKRPEFRQVCVWEGQGVSPTRASDFELYMMREFGVRVQYLEGIQTDPEFDDHFRSRHDLFFAVHDNDIIPFAYPRASAGIRWLEDVLSEIRSGNRIYPERVFDYSDGSDGQGYEESCPNDDEDKDFWLWDGEEE